MMIAVLKDVLERAEKWPAEAQRELAELALEMEAAIGSPIYRAEASELAAIDEADGDATANADEVEAAFAVLRGR